MFTQLLTLAIQQVKTSFICICIKRQHCYLSIWSCLLLRQSLIGPYLLKSVCFKCEPVSVPQQWDISALFVFDNDTLRSSGQFAATSYLLHSLPDLRFKVGSTTAIEDRFGCSQHLCESSLWFIALSLYPPHFAPLFLLQRKTQIPFSNLKRHDWSGAFSSAHIHSPTMFGCSVTLPSYSGSASIQGF